MDSYKQYIKEALPDLSIHSYMQNEEGWDNITVIINDELLFRFPRKLEYANRIPLEKELCTILSHSLQEIEIPKYHLLYKNDCNTVPFCSYYPLIHGEPLTSELVAKLEKKELEVIITQLATFLATLHSIPLKRTETLGFPIEKTLTYWKELQTKLNQYFTNSLTSLQKSALNRLFENFFTCITKSTFQNAIIHADFTHHHILFNNLHKNISGVIDFGDAQIGDPAFDFAGLYYDFGREFTTSVYEQYSALISHRDPLLIHRITTFYQYSPLLHNLIYNIETNNEIILKKNEEQLKAILQGRD
ncbi:aminoglycoside phosphotransferase family protein [Bacillus mycoides]|uniref:Aminoglycoside phosphotransferase n=1 Tax=Bacillus thuringiensis serovar navarrensis TaxID=339658 RepID=A0A243A0J5_BACTU|nr:MULTISPECIES: aminoglycoside phosphotransferase family protein [Bacillus]EEL07199.1 Aminoglycoside phosphotransferase [Bacillus cereus BDRD-ST196]AIW86233.1 Aminoglycoside phosphotransferase [Bacillus mycoides]MBK5486934.1 aminoglycoside phosphotransferase family protein [Bacillus sp. TH17]MCQ6526878.1 aminoglycoside phosphotransferase family protein [Bacillus mycoides]MEC5241026.1 aminoglycoside phosphotransferase family protein [Bacillus mycoides]